MREYPVQRNPYSLIFYALFETMIRHINRIVIYTGLTKKYYQRYIQGGYIQEGYRPEILLKVNFLTGIFQGFC